MRRPVFALFVAAVLAPLAAARPAHADDAAVARGAYLAAAAGCDQCHTDRKNGGPPYAGRPAAAGEIGGFPTPNITPDRDTGIGAWSDADFVRAMRWGVAPDGTHYVSAFPFLYFGRLADGDLSDLKAFLDSLPAVRREPAAAPLALLVRARSAIGVALAEVDIGAVPAAAPGGADPVARGAYLVATVGHCGDCHTPLGWLGAPDTSRFLAGSPGGLHGRKAPDITPDPASGIGGWSEDDIVSLLKDGMTPDGDFVGGSMAEIVRNTARLSDADRHAIAAYLKTVPAKRFAGKD